MKAEREERRTMQEQLGSALNASVLTIAGRSPNVETPLQQVAALGGAMLQIHHGADRGGRGLAETVADPGHRVDPQDALAAKLVSNLFRIRNARRHELVPSTIAMFCAWMTYRGRFNALPDAATVLPKFAARVLHEWLSDKCTRCGGSGRLELMGDGKAVRGRGRMQRNAMFVTCTGRIGCGGSGRQVPSHTARRMALGMSMERYDQERWDRNYQAALHWLSVGLSKRLNRPLTQQLDRSTKRE